MKRKITEIMDKLNLVEEMRYKISYDQFQNSWKALEFPNTIREKANRTLLELDKKEKVLAVGLREFQAELDHDISVVNGEFDRFKSNSNLQNVDDINGKFQELGIKIEKALAQS